MRLRNKIFSQVLIYFAIVMSIWGVAFYFVIIEEIQDETDDYLQIYAQQIITLHNSGSAIPKQHIVSNNSYFLQEISQEEALNFHHARFYNEDVFIPEKDETEPARIFQTIFSDRDGQFFMLKVSIPTFEIDEVKSAIFYAVFFLFSILLFLLLLINVFVFRRAMKPLYNLLKWIKSYTIGKKETYLLTTDSKITEFQELYTAMNSGVIKNENIFEQQKQFISNASHELHTPLAVCKNRIEMLLENEAIQEKELVELSKIELQINKLIKLNKTLLFLSKIDNQQFIDKQEVVFNELINGLLVDLQEIFYNKNINLQIFDSAKFQFNINNTLASSLVSNLLKNAFVHTEKNGKIKIIINNDSITFQNTGSAELDKERVFSRFYAQGNQENSTGLGLAIAESICRNYNLKIDYVFQNNQHIFTVSKKKIFF